MNRSMSKETAHRHKLLEEVAKFQKNMEELRLLRTVSSDLRSYRRMIRIKRND
jgi:ribosomal protein S19